MCQKIKNSFFPDRATQASYPGWDPCIILSYEYKIITNLLDLNNDILEIIADYLKKDKSHRFEKEMILNLKIIS